MFLDSLKYSFNNLKDVIRGSLQIFLGFLVLSITTDFVKLSLGQGSGSAELIVGIVEVLATYFFYAVIIKNCFSLIEEKQVRGVGLGFLIYLRINIIYSLLFFLGMFLILPGIWVLIFLFFAPFVALDDHHQGGKFLKRSAQLVKRDILTVSILAVISVVLMSIDFAIFPLIKRAELWQLGIVVKNFVMILIDYIFLILCSKVYTQLKRL